MNRPVVVVVHFASNSQLIEKDSSLHMDLLPAIETCAKGQLFVEQKNAAKGKSLKELLYGLESLRKRASDDANDENE